MLMTMGESNNTNLRFVIDCLQFSSFCCTICVIQEGTIKLNTEEEDACKTKVKTSPKFDMLLDLVLVIFIGFVR